MNGPKARLIWRLWNEGFNTLEIAEELSLTEAAVYNFMYASRKNEEAVA